MIHNSEVIARRGVLVKAGCADVRFELRRGDYDFGMFENEQGVGAFWRTPTPQEAMSGSARALTVDEAWSSCVAKRYPGYTQTALEDLVAE